MRQYFQLCINCSIFDPVLRACAVKSSLLSADEQMIATLPYLEKVPATFDDVVELGAYIFRGLTPEERKAGTVRSAQLLRVPGQHVAHAFMTCSAWQFVCI